MAKKKEQASTGLIKRHRKKRPGVHSKKKNSKSKKAKNYKKKYVGQGKP